MKTARVLAALMFAAVAAPALAQETQSRKTHHPKHDRQHDCSHDGKKDHPKRRTH